MTPSETRAALEKAALQMAWQPDAASALSVLSAKLAELGLKIVPVEATEWVSVEDKLPPAHMHVWCLNADGWHFEGCICYGMHKPFFTIPRGDGSASNTAPNWINVTHWRLLPAMLAAPGVLGGGDE